MSEVHQTVEPVIKRAVKVRVLAALLVILLANTVRAEEI